MKTLITLTATVMLIAVAAASATGLLTSSRHAVAPAVPAAVSIQELQDRVDIRSLPELTIQDPV